MITNFYLTFNYSIFYKIPFGKLAIFHSPSWRIFIRQVGRVLFGKLAKVSGFQSARYKRHLCTEKHTDRFLSAPS